MTHKAALNTLIWCGDQGLGVEKASPRILGEAHPLIKRDIGRISDWLRGRDPNFKGNIASTVWSRQKSDFSMPRLVVCGPCRSTMTVSRSLAEKKILFPWDSLIALSQHGGCGQYGRHWLSPPGNIYASFILPPPETLSRKENWSPVLSLLCGYAVCKALEESGYKVRLKWPNDLILDDQKIGGIIISIKEQIPICGVGINVSSSPSDHQLRSDHAMKASSLSMVDSLAAPLGLWQRIYSASIETIKKTVDYFSISDLMGILSEKLIWAGERVLITPPGDAPFEAYIQGIACDGGLIIRKSTGIETIYTGSIIPI